MDAQKPAREIPFGRKCRTIPRYPHPAPPKQGMNPFLTKQNDAIYNKNGDQIERILCKNLWIFVLLSDISTVEKRHWQGIDAMQ